MQGVVTPLDVLEGIAGELPGEDETLAIQKLSNDQWSAAGTPTCTNWSKPSNRMVWSATMTASRLRPAFCSTASGVSRLATRCSCIGIFEFRVRDADRLRIKTIGVARVSPPASLVVNGAGS